jgi:hypothetical protein
MELDIATAKRRTSTLQLLLGIVGKVLGEYFVTAAQRQRFEDFKIDVLAEADSEICHASNMGQIEERRERMKANTIKKVRTFSAN